MSAAIVCPWCQRPTRLVWVHGHGQCEHCRINIEPCCSGALCEPAPEPQTLTENDSPSGKIASGSTSFLAMPCS